MRPFRSSTALLLGKGAESWVKGVMESFFELFPLREAWSRRPVTKEDLFIYDLLPFNVNFTPCVSHLVKPLSPNAGLNLILLQLDMLQVTSVKLFYQTSARLPCNRLWNSLSSFYHSKSPLSRDSCWNAPQASMCLSLSIYLLWAFSLISSYRKNRSKSQKKFTKLPCFIIKNTCRIYPLIYLYKKK